ncbi:NB-ARC domain-containing protein, partial [Magnetococcales bacterium HHB-1]
MSQYAQSENVGSNINRVDKIENQTFNISRAITPEERETLKKQRREEMALPAPYRLFTGREDKVKSLVEQFQWPGTTSVIQSVRGVGGIGKTALSIVVANRLREETKRYKDYLFIYLAGNSERPRSTREVMRRLLEARYGDAPKEEELEQHYIAALAQWPVFLVFDDAKDYQQVESLLVDAHKASFLITSRKQITGYDSQINLPPLSQEKALEFLKGILNQTRTDDQTLKDIVESCGYLPLMVKAAGQYLLMSPPGVRYAKRLLKRLQAFRNLQSSAFLKELSCDGKLVAAILFLTPIRLLLDHGEVIRHWQMLTLFEHPFNLEMVMALWQVEEEEVEDHLARL